MYLLRFKLETPNKKLDYEERIHVYMHTVWYSRFSHVQETFNEVLTCHFTPQELILLTTSGLYS
jgi:hypothetical protein